MGIKKTIRGIRDSIPGGYVLGRIGAGSGPPSLIKFTPNAQGGIGGGNAARASSRGMAVEFFAGKTLTDGETVGQIIIPVGFTLPLGLLGSYAEAVTASTGTSVLTIRKATVAGGVGASIGTITFTTSATGVLSFAADVSFVPGDRLLVVAPTPADSGLADISILLLGRI